MSHWGAHATLARGTIVPYYTWLTPALSLHCSLRVETDSNSNEGRALRRCKLRLLELILKARVDALYLDPGVMLTSPEYLPSLIKHTETADLAIASDAHLGFTDPVQNDYGCLGVSNAYSKFIRDWISAGQFYLRSTAAARWFLKEVRMAKHHAVDGRTTKNWPQHLPLRLLVLVRRPRS